MATIVSIKQKIEQLDAGSFQVLCDAYLSREGYPNPVSLGTKAGTQKTTQGTPDTYFCLANGKYVLAEYTTQRPGLAGKIRSDLEKCFDSQLSGINNDDITEIIYCHTSSGIDAGADKSLKRYCQDKGVQLTMIGIDKLAEDISRKYPILAKEHLGLSVDTEQIQDPLDFVRQYDASALAAPLNTNFLFRENEIVRLQKAFDENNVVILSGAAGTGKTRLALEFAERFQKEHTAVKIYVIHNHGLPIYDDLKQHFECPGDYFVIVDDANQLSQLDLIIEYVNKKDNGYNVRILATVRNYALQKVKADIAGIVHYSEVTLDSLSDDEIKSLVKDYLGIINRDYLNRIATIAEGNARIALIAGKVAVDANGLQSISDVTGLYEEYYGKAFKEANLDGDLQLQITAGVIAFLGSIHLDHIEPVLNLLVGYNIDISVFKSCAYKLHEMELVDICKDKAVAISDQCFANYILKHVFVDKKTISLAQMLDTCFQTYRKRTIQAVNTLLGVFQSQDVYDFTIHEIKVVWKKRKSESFNKYWDWVKAFYQVDQVETLLLIKERIDNTEKVELSVDEIDVNEGKNYQSVDDELIVILGGFADTHNIESALDLFFDYYLKRPDLYCEIPSEAIDAAKVEELYAYLKCDYDREIHTAGYRSLKFLERYESVESDIIINAARLIFAKKDYSPFIVNIYFSLIFNRHHCEPKSVIQKFAKDLQLLEEIYLFESVHDRLADADGAFLKELCCCRKAFAKDYIDTLLKDNHHRLHDDNEKLHALFECPDFIDIIDLLVDGCSQTSFPLFDYPPVMKTLIFVPDNIKHKSDAWIKHYISKYNTDYEKMESLFSVLSELCDDRKKDYISYRCACGAE